ncbi:magnesium-translocating P-type ATPase [Mycobacterium sp. DL592]|uniref:magnesium-translocating P-type ATPase n=1 Tax=Mycobacterium sp. DL592 TaxID=2675524 RepID=UPI001AAF45EC|nr:magnesium-translocating P-type ATPase [Mycobacterium sp. DL592]
MSSPGTRTVLDRLAADYSWLHDVANESLFTLLQRLDATLRGLTEQAAAERNPRPPAHRVVLVGAMRLLNGLSVALRSPFVALLVGLGVVLGVLGDVRGAGTVTTMVVVAIVVRWWQHNRAARALRSLQHHAAATATVRRRACADAQPIDREVPLPDVVLGDVIVLHAGNVVPADVRIVSATGLLVDQSALTGEALPSRKFAADGVADQSVAMVPNVCFQGTGVVAGSGVAVVIATGADTYFDRVSRAAADCRRDSSFDRGVRYVGWSLVRFMLVLVPVVFAVSGMIRGTWEQAALFAVAVAVGLTPELLPVIVTTNLARGATRLARKHVVVQRLNAIQDLGAVDVLCVDKTGTLTENRVIFAHSVDVSGCIEDAAGEFAYLAVHFQDDQSSVLDDAIANLLGDQQMRTIAEAAYCRVDEIAFDSVRRRSTTVLTRQSDRHMVICKGDPDEVVRRCTKVFVDHEIHAISDGFDAEAADTLDAFRRHGMRVLAVAMKDVPARLGRYDEHDESDLVLIGFIGFVDPLRETAGHTIAQLREHGVEVKVLTGDSRIVARVVAGQVGIDCSRVTIGSDIDKLSDVRLRKVVSNSAVFAELSPNHKTRIVSALRESSRVVGFLGDGANDVPAMRLADAGIAASGASPVVSDAADLVLLKEDLAVVANGVVEGRKTLANTMKYVKITASSNFGNVLSVVAASAFLPFLPILPIQLLVQNLIYDTAQLALPWDRVEANYLRTPHRWEATHLISFMLVFGPLSSLFDMLTFAMLWWVYHLGSNVAAFQSCWFLESLLTQLVVVLVLRSRELPWRGSRVAPVVVAVTAMAAVGGIALSISPAASLLHLQAPPVGYAWWLVAVTLAYAFAAHIVKQIYIRRRGRWL